MVLVESFSGIRGVYEEDLTDEIAERYAYAYYELLVQKTKNPKIVIGRDTRPSGKAVLNSMIKRLNCEIIDAGVLPTPAIENAVRAFNADGGIIITASHNEPDFNGFKFLDTDGALLRPKDNEFVINKFHEIKKIEYSCNKQKMMNMEKEALDEYKTFLKDILKTDTINSKIKILVDPNGGSGILSKEIFDEFKVNAEYINMEEGEFKRLVEPNEALLRYLLYEINKNKCDFAIGFDCDADRVEILLNDGSLVSGNQILALISEEILSHSNKDKTIVVNDATSYLVKEIGDRYNAQWKEVEVGEINVVDEMIKTKAQIGGEGSNGGVIILPSKCRDGILTILVLLKLIEEKKKTLKEIINELPKYYYFKEKIKLKEDFVFIREKIKDHYLKNGFEILETGDKTGGLKAIINSSWIWFRQSKTEDKVLRIIADSKDENISIKLLEEAKGLLN